MLMVVRALTASLLCRSFFVHAFSPALRTKLFVHVSRQMCTPAAEVPAAALTELSRLEIRVGKIVEVGIHPEGDSLFVEKVDMGEAEPRTIISGLVGFQTKEQLLNRFVVVLANLKPRAIKGITSNGMLLCASNADKSKVDPLTPPVNAKVGELIKFAGHISEPVEPGNRATKAYSKVADGFFTNAEGVATYESIPFMTPEGPCTSILVGPIS